MNVRVCVVKRGEGGQEVEVEVVRGTGKGRGLKLHVEISICARLAEEEAGAGNNCHSPRGPSGTGHWELVRVMDSGRLIINLAK